MENPVEMRGRIVELLKKSNDILIAISGPDGDSIGASLALALVLQKLGRKITIIAPAQVADEHKFLPAISQIKSDLGEIKKDFVIEIDLKGNKIENLKYEVKDNKLRIILTPLNNQLNKEQISLSGGSVPYDLIVTCDTGDRHQLGKLDSDYADIFDKVTVINIDHHASNSNFGDINYVFPDCASTTEVLYPILEELQGENDFIDADVATLLLTGLIADTGSFVHSNTSPSAFRLASKLLAKGARQQDIIKNLFKTKPLAMLKLWGKVLSKLKFDPTYNIAWSSITNDDLQSCSAKLEHGEGIIDELLTNAPGTRIAMLLKEKEPGLISGSLRSTTDEANVSDVAGIFDGGGHVRAAGFRFKYEGDFESAEKVILNKIRDYLGSKMNISEEDKQSAEEKVHQMSIEINGKRYDFNEEDIKEMAMKFLFSEKKIFVPIKDDFNKLNEGENVDLKKWWGN